MRRNRQRKCVRCAKGKRKSFSHFSAAVRFHNEKQSWKMAGRHTTFAEDNLSLEIFFLLSLSSHSMKNYTWRWQSRKNDERIWGEFEKFEIWVSLGVRQRANDTPHWRRQRLTAHEERRERMKLKLIVDTSVRCVRWDDFHDRNVIFFSNKVVGKL